MGKYVESHLNRNETVVKAAKRTRLFLVGTWIKGVLLCWLLLIPTVKAIINTLAYKKSELAITNRRVIGKIGLINTQTLDAPLNKVQNTSTESGFWGKVFHYGTVSINTAAGVIHFTGIKQPEEFKTTLMNQIEEYEQSRIQEQAAQMATAMSAAIAVNK